MDQELISKKELLETFGISYGTGNLLPPGPDLPAGPADPGQQGAPDPGRAGGQSGGEASDRYGPAKAHY